MTDHLNTVLSLRDDQIEFDAKQLAVLQTALKVKHATREDLALLFHQARRTGLDPFAKQLYMIARMEWDPDARAKVWKQTLQTGIDGFRLVARRAADRSGQQISYDDPIWFDKDGREHEVWLSSEPPVAAKAVVYRGEGRFPFVAMFAEYVPLKDEYEPDKVDDKGKKIKGEKTGKRVPSGMWATRPAGQLYKCAEAGALRMACPQDLSGIYVIEEMQRGDVIDVEPVSVAHSSAADNPPSGKDWLAELEACASGEEVTAVWNACRRAGERTVEFDTAARERGAWFRDNLTTPTAQDDEDAANEEPGTEEISDTEPVDVTSWSEVPDQPDQPESSWPETAKPGSDAEEKK